MQEDRKQQSIGQSRYYLDALDQASRLATLDRPVLILGERGSGKELMAHRTHFLSPRWEEPFIKVNCAALSETLVESTLFGHEAGSFTGAIRSQPGYFERVGEGTLFLDEIATLSLRIQEKLLRVLEYGEFERLGGQKTLVTRGRIIGATHGNLHSMAEKGEFRNDLLDRIAFDVIHTPPLRVREDDILLLAEHFAVSFVRQLDWDFFPGFSEAVQQQLLQYSWPGNIRELKNVVERSLFRCKNPEEPISEINLDPFQSPWKNTKINAANDVDLAKRKIQESEKSQKIIQETIPEKISEESLRDFKGRRENWEKQQILAAMELAQHHQGRAASILGLSYDQFRVLWRRFN
ncbi:phage shock protein operon transcriptional activator [Sessilibacter sp. MAH4]